MNTNPESTDPEGCIREIIDYVSRRSDGRYDPRALTEIDTPDFKREVDDSATKLYLPGVRPEHNAVLMISQRAFPDAVERAVRNAVRARSTLSGRCAEVVSEPLESGRRRGLSFAVWPEFRALSKSRLIRGVQKKMLIPRVCGWLRTVALQSIHRLEDEERIHRYLRLPLESMVEHEALPEPVRSAAGRALGVLEQGAHPPVTVLQHSDFWLGNILLCPRRRDGLAHPFGFRVIDWGGARFHGAPYFDLIRYCMSSTMGLARARRHLGAYTAALNLSPGDASLHVLAALGRIGLTLEEFPLERYVKLCDQSVRFLEHTGLWG